MHSPNNFRLAAMFCWLAAGCEKTPDEVISTNQTISSIEEPPSDRPLNMDEEFLAIAKVAPGFGGAFLDNESMKVVVTDSSAIPEVRAALEQAIRSASEWSDLALFVGQEFKFQTGQFGWADLFRWRRAFDDRMPRDMSYSDIDEARNRVEIGMMDETGIAKALTLGKEIGIPSEAFGAHLAARMIPSNLRVVAPFLKMFLGDSLLGHVRPTGGG